MLGEFAWRLLFGVCVMPVILSVQPFIPFRIGSAPESHMVVESNRYALRTGHAQDVIYDFADGLRPAKRAWQKKTLIGSFHSLIFAYLWEAISASASGVFTGITAHPIRKDF